MAVLLCSDTPGEMRVVERADHFGIGADLPVRDVQSTVKLRHPGSDPRSFSPRIAPISRMRISAGWYPARFFRSKIEHGGDGRKKAVVTRPTRQADSES